MDIKIEGLNGQLPNLDLFNLASKMCTKEGVYQTFKNKGPFYSRKPSKEWLNYFRNMLSMMGTQATGVSKDFCKRKWHLPIYYVVIAAFTS